jgi:maleate isomerase
MIVEARNSVGKRSNKLPPVALPEEAQAVFIAGNGFRAVGAIEALEAMIGRPVLTSNQVLLWQLLALAGATFEVRGYGQLFTHEPLPPR